MSRSYYSKDWQNRKSLLIRSLFHDIPILSPVPEESNESAEIIQPFDYYDAPSRANYPTTEDPRPYSPLPPLIIEKEPNRHDEPEEYYQKLFIKIKKIYKKLFIENLDLNSDEYDLSRYASSFEEDISKDNELSNNNFELMDTDQQIDDDLNLTRRESSNSTNFKGYAADSESEDEVSEENDSNFDDKDINNENMSNELNDEQSSNETEESNELESNEEEHENDLIKYQRTDNDDSRLKRDFNEGSETSNINIVQDMEITFEVDPHSTNYSEESFNTDIGKITNVNGGAKVTKDSLEAIVHEAKLKSQDNKSADSNNDLDEVMEKDIDSTESSKGIDFRQVTTQALVHNDGTQEAVERESRIYEDSEKSIVLPTRATNLNKARYVDVQDKIEECAFLEELGDPETTSMNTSESQNNHIEVMRTPRLESHADSIHDLHCSDSSNSAEPTAATASQEELDHITTLEDEIGDNTDLNEDINDVLSAIINDSHNANDATADNVRLARKRKIYEETAAQTESEKVTWDEIKYNFFVGTPKIFKLCSCVDHVCQY